MPLDFQGIFVFLGLVPAGRIWHGQAAFFDGMQDSNDF